MKKFIKLKVFKVNFGPQHPAAHGVLRLILELNGELVTGADAHIGFLHRGTEKLSEFKSLTQTIPYLDRLDYVSMMTQEHAFVLAAEKITRTPIDQKVEIIRVLYSEITRLLNHLMAITTHALDVGALTPFLWGFEEREKLMEFYEVVSGARMHAAYFRVGGIAQHLPATLIDDIFNFYTQFHSRLTEIEELLTNNKIWQIRLQKVGCISAHEALNRNFGGPVLRSCGIKWDLRKNLPYECYDIYNFSIPVGEIGDSYTRYLIRIEEMWQSLRLINQCINQLTLNKLTPEYHGIYKPLHGDAQKRSMEDLIRHFKHATDEELFANGEIYCGVESPKGEFGIYLVNYDTTKIYRCKIKSPGYSHLQGLDYMSYNHFLADVTTIIGTQDIVFGEIDR